MYIHLSNLRVKDLGYIIPKRPTKKRPKDVWMELATDHFFKKIRMATWWSKPSYLPHLSVSERKGDDEMGCDGLPAGRVSSGPQTKEPPLYILLVLRQSSSSGEQRPGRRVVCLLRYEDPWTNQQHEVSETSPQGKNTATKLVTNTAI